MHHPEHAREVALFEEALTVLFCLMDDIYQNVSLMVGATRAWRSLRTRRS